MTLEWFNPNIGSPIVSIADYGITFSRSAVEIMGRPEYVALGFNKEKKQIVVMPDPEDSNYGISFIEKERWGYVRINNRDFIRFVMRYVPEISITSKATRYLSYYEDENKQLIVELTRPLDESDNYEIKEDQQDT